VNKKNQKILQFTSGCKTKVEAFLLTSWYVANYVSYWICTSLEHSIYNVLHPLWHGVQEYNTAATVQGTRKLQLLSYLNLLPLQRKENPIYVPSAW